MGLTLTHKKIILQKLIFEGKNVQTVCRETTAGRSPATGCPKGERSEANRSQPRGRAALHHQLQAGAPVQKAIFFEFLDSRNHPGSEGFVQVMKMILEVL